MIFDFLFSKFLSGLSKISSFSVKLGLQRFEIGPKSCYMSFIFQDIRWLSCMLF